MTPIAKKRLGQFSRSLAGLALLLQLFQLHAFSFPLFYVGAAGFILCGSLRARRQGKWIILADWLLLYLSLFLLPPGLLAMTTSIIWLLAGLALAVGGGALAWRLTETRRAFFQSALIILALTSSTGFFNVLRFRPMPMPEHWAGMSSTLDDRGWEGTTPVPILFNFFPLPETGPSYDYRPYRDPPTSTVFGLLEDEDSAFSLRSFVQAPHAEINPDVFKIQACNPVTDIGYDRSRHRWAILCRDGRLVFHGNETLGILQSEKFDILRPTALAIHQTRDRLYVIDPPLGRLSEFDLKSGELLRTESVGLGSSDIAVAPDGEALYVAQPYWSRLVVLDAATLEKITDISLRFGVSTLAVDKTRRRIYAASFTNGYLFAIDARSRTLLASTPLHSPVLDLAYNHATGRIYWSTPKGFRQADIAELFGDELP